MTMKTSPVMNNFKFTRNYSLLNENYSDLQGVKNVGLN
jgi:hypothetical protein